MAPDDPGMRLGDTTSGARGSGQGYAPPVHALADPTLLAPAGFGLFMVVWLGVVALSLGGFLVGVVALIDVAQTPVDRFGPWWDNTRQIWIIGIAVSFLIPAGSLVAGILWFSGGRRGLRATGVAGRPFWAGAPKPPPPWSPTPPGSTPPGSTASGWAPPAPPPGWGPQPPA
jgi:hypothetical protein